MSSSTLPFAGSIPAKYDALLGPFLFQPYAKLVSDRLAPLQPEALLEIAAGTGIVTRQMKTRMPNTVVTSTDFSEDMLTIAKQKFEPGEVIFMAADGQALPFPDQSFDAVVCCFGIMFMPDKDLAVREALRVLRPGGIYLFTVWDSPKVNVFAQIVIDNLTHVFGDQMPEFPSIPWHYHDRVELKSILERNGFDQVEVKEVAHQATGIASALAEGMVAGNPVSIEIEKLGKSVAEVQDRFQRLITENLGPDPFTTTIQAVICTGVKP